MSAGFFSRSVCFSNPYVAPPSAGVGAGEADWIARSTASGVYRAIRFQTSAEVTDNVLPDAKAGNVTWDTSLKRSGNGSMRFAVNDADGANSGNWRYHIKADQSTIGNGGEYYVQWSQYMPAAFCHTAFPGSGGGGKANGFKQIICSWYAASNQNNEVVMENSGQMGCPRGYHQDSVGSFLNFEVAFNSSPCNTTDFKWQNAIDNGGVVTNCATAHQRWGPMYSMTTQTGTPDANNGGVLYVADTWMTFEIRIKIGTLGSADSTVEMWGAVSGSPPRKLISFVGNVNLGTDNSGHNAIWLLPYNSLRTGGGGISTYTNYDEVITSASRINFPGGYGVAPSGASALSVAAAALANDAWGTLTISNTFNPDPSGTGDTMMSYCQRAVYDKNRKVIHFFGGCHGAAGSLQRQFLVTYDLTTNSWNTPVAVPDGSLSFEHSYYNQTVDPVTGYVYMRSGFGSKDIKRYDYDNRTFLSDWVKPFSNTNYDVPLEYHPVMGSVIYGHYWGVASRASGAGSWTTITTANRIGDENPVGTYNAKDSCVYMGGGGGAGAGQLWKINSSGTMTSVSAAPSGVTLALWSAGSASSTAMLMGAGNPSNKMVAIAKGGDIYEYDEGSNLWSGSINNLPASLQNPGVNAGADWIACRVEDENCIVFFKLASMTSSSTTMHIWKR